MSFAAFAFRRVRHVMSCALVVGTSSQASLAIDERCSRPNVHCADIESGSVGNVFALNVKNNDREPAHNVKVTDPQSAARYLRPGLVRNIRIDPPAGLVRPYALPPDGSLAFTVRFDGSPDPAASGEESILLDVVSEDDRGNVIPRGRFEIVLNVGPRPMGNVRIEVGKKKPATTDGERKQGRP